MGRRLHISALEGRLHFDFSIRILFILFILCKSCPKSPSALTRQTRPRTIVAP
jgi:hypothetical protein